MLHSHKHDKHDKIESTDQENVMTGPPPPDTPADAPTPDKSPGSEPHVIPPPDPIPLEPVEPLQPLPKEPTPKQVDPPVFPAKSSEKPATRSQITNAILREVVASHKGEPMSDRVTFVVNVARDFLNGINPSDEIVGVFSNSDPVNSQLLVPIGFPPAEILEFAFPPQEPVDPPPVEPEKTIADQLKAMEENQSQDMVEHEPVESNA